MAELLSKPFWLKYIVKNCLFLFLFSSENCTDYKLQFERVFSVPGDVAMLSSTLVSPGVFNFSVVPYNVTWYHLLSGRQLGNETGRVLVRGETLWFLNVTLEDAGDYVCIVRYYSLILERLCCIWKIADLQTR